jgi:hypothetical protein
VVTWAWHRQGMSSRHHLVAIILGVGTILVAFATLESPAHALGSPVVAVAASGLATAVTIDRRERLARRR